MFQKYRGTASAIPLKTINRYGHLVITRETHKGYHYGHSAEIRYPATEQRSI